MSNYPHSPKAEEDLIGAILLDPSELPKVLYLKPIDFYIETNRWIWEVFLELHKLNKTIDLDLICIYLDKHKRLKEIGGAAELTRLLNGLPPTYHVVEYAHEIRDRSLRRQAIQQAERLVSKASDLESDFSSDLITRVDNLQELSKDAAPEVTQTSPTRKTSWTVEELYNTEFPEPSWIIPGIIPAGLVFLGGRPKVGKSWLALQTSYAVSTGGRLFEKQITRGDVLYLAYEDNERRLKDRAAKMQIPPGASIRFETEWKPLQGGGLSELLIALEGHPYRLVVIDTLTRSIPGVDQIDASAVGPIVSNLQTLAIGRNITIIVVDHTRKPNGVLADPIDDILASTAKTATADAILALYKEPGRAGATLKGRGRDIDDIDLALEFDPLTSAWQSKGDAMGLEMTEHRAEIIQFLQEEGKAQAGTIAKAINQDRGNTAKRLADLINAGLVKKEIIEGKVFYEVLHK